MIVMSSGPLVKRAPTLEANVDPFPVSPEVSIFLDLRLRGFVILAILWHNCKTAIQEM